MIKGAVKPDYMKIRFKTSKEFVVVVKRTIEYEKLEPESVWYADTKRYFDVALIAQERIVIIRAVKGKKSAHMQEFEREQWDRLTDPDRPDVIEFLKNYSNGVRMLDEHWR